MRSDCIVIYVRRSDGTNATGAVGAPPAACGRHGADDAPPRPLYGRPLRGERAPPERGNQDILPNPAARAAVGRRLGSHYPELPVAARVAGESGELVLRDWLPAGHPRLRQPVGRSRLPVLPLVAKTLRPDPASGHDRLRDLSPGAATDA